MQRKDAYTYLNTIFSVIIALGSRSLCSFIIHSIACFNALTQAYSWPLAATNDRIGKLFSKFTWLWRVQKMNACIDKL